MIQREKKKVSGPYCIYIQEFQPRVLFVSHNNTNKNGREKKENDFPLSLFSHTFLLFLKKSSR